MVTATVPPYLMEPPGDEKPAVVAGLVTDRPRPGTGDGFAATLFDLIRRGYIEAIPLNRIEKTWGGVREEMVMSVLGRPPEHALLCGALRKAGEHELEDAPRFIGTVREIPMIAGADREHAPRP